MAYKGVEKFQIGKTLSDIVKIAVFIELKFFLCFLEENSISKSNKKVKLS